MVDIHVRTSVQVMRFMGDHTLAGVKQMVLGNYIIQKVEYI